MAEAAQSTLISFKREFDNQLTCSVCLDMYNVPKTLPCHHSFCLECIQGLKVEIKVYNLIHFIKAILIFDISLFRMRSNTSNVPHAVMNIHYLRKVLLIL